MFPILPRFIKQSTLSSSKSRHFSIIHSTRSWSKDPEVRRRQYDERNDRARLRYAIDPDFRSQELARMKHEAHYERKRLRLERYSADPVWRLGHKFYRWVRHNAWVRELEWKTHQPILYPERKEHLCSSCDQKRFGGRKLWWRRKAEDELFDCHTCFMKDWSGGMPQGYSDEMIGKVKRPSNSPSGP